MYLFKEKTKQYFRPLKSGLFWVFILVFGLYTYVHVKYPQQCAQALQSMREEANPEYYILQELRK